MPAGARTGLPREGPRGLESVLKRRLNSQNGVVRPASVVTWYASPQWRMAVTRRSLPTCFETDRSRCGVAREGQRAVRVEPLDVAVAVALVAEAVAAAEARDVLQLVAVLDGVPVQPLDLSGPRELGKLPPGQHLDLVADLVSGHRRGCYASCRPGQPRGDRGRASPVRECPALHRWSSSSSGGLTIALPLNLCESPPLVGCRDAPCRR